MILREALVGLGFSQHHRINQIGQLIRVIGLGNQNNILTIRELILQFFLGIAGSQENR